MGGSAVTSDCELIRGGWPVQPVNGYSSLAFVIVGLWLFVTASSPRERLVGVGSGFVGVGSLVFHGSGGRTAAFLHDWSIVVLLLTLAGVLTGSRVSVVIVTVGAALTGVLLATTDGVGEWAGAAALAAVLARIVTVRKRLRRAWLLSAVLLASAGAVLFAGGRSGGFWCVPDSIVQPHAGWHVLAAAAVAALVAASRDRAVHPGVAT